MYYFSGISLVIIVYLSEISIRLSAGESFGAEFIVLFLFRKYLLPRVHLKGRGTALLRSENFLNFIFECLAIFDRCAEFIFVTLEIVLVETWGMFMHHRFVPTI